MIFSFIIFYIYIYHIHRMPFNSAHGDDRYDSNSTRGSISGGNLYPQYTPEEGYTPVVRKEFEYKPLTKEPPKYIQSGNREDVPKYNSTEMMIINGGIEKDLIEYYRTNPDFSQELEGAGVKKFFRSIKKSANNTGKQISNVANQAGKEIKKVSIKAGDEIKKSATDKNGIIRQAISATADSVLPALGTAVGTYFGNPIAGEVIGQTGRNVLKAKTGYGNKGLAVKCERGVGVYKGGSAGSTKQLVQAEINKAINQYLPEGVSNNVMGKGVGESEPEKPKKPIALKNKPNINDNRTERNKLVKLVMVERGVSLPQASKLVKAEGLFKPKL
jgi:hypothetical protein